MRCRLDNSKECATLPEAEKYPQGLALSPWGGFSVGAGMVLAAGRLHIENSWCPTISVTPKPAVRSASATRLLRSDEMTRTTVHPRAKRSLLA
jgi:hypothetical protein